MAVQINVAANQAALTASIQAGVQAYNQRFAQNNQLNLTVNQRAFSQPLGRMTGDVKDFEAALAASNARVIAFGASTAVLGGVIRSFKELANVTIEVEKSLADINRVFGLTTSQLQKFSTDLFSVSKQTASSFDDASKAALEFSRQGLKAEDVLMRTKDALTLTRLAGIGTANAVDALTSTVNGFAATGVTTTQILNKLVAVEQDYAVGAGDLAEALSRTGQAAQEAGVSLDQLNALVTAAQQSTARGGAVIGNALKTIFTRLQRSETLDQLEAFNIAVRDVQGNTLPAVNILQNFAGAYKGLADAQRAQLSEQVAGVYQVNILKAIVGDLNKSQGVYAGALQRGASATNEAEIATAKLNQTLDALLKQTATSTQQLANNIGKVTFEPLAKYGTEQLKSLVESMNEILEGEGVGSTFANGLLKGIRNIIAGPGAIAAFFTLFKLIQNSFTYLAQALPQIAGITTETQNRKNIEQSILQIMQQQGPISQALAGTMGNQAAQAQLLLQIARQQTAEYQMQSTLAKQLAVQLAGQGVRVKGSGGLQVTRAGGYIPNATKMAEVVGAQAGGYTPGKVISSPVGGVMNTAEDVKYIPGFAQPFINPPVGSKAGRTHRQNAISRTGVDPYMYSGFIPNFINKKDQILFNKQVGRAFEDQVGMDIGMPPSFNKAIDFTSVPTVPSDPLKEYNKSFYSSQTFADAYSGTGHNAATNIGKVIRHLNLNYNNILKNPYSDDYFFDGKDLLLDPNFTEIIGKGKDQQIAIASSRASSLAPDSKSVFLQGLNKKQQAKALSQRITMEFSKDKVNVGYNKFDGFIPNFAPPTSAIRVPWFKKFGNAAFDTVQPSLGISKASDLDTFRQVNFRSKAKGADKIGDNNIFAPLYEDFVFKAMQLVSQPNIKDQLIRGYALQPGTDQKQSAFDAFLGDIALEYKGFPKSNLTGSISGNLNDKYERFAKANPAGAAKIKESIITFNELGHENQLPSVFGKTFSQLAGTSYSQMLKNSPDLVKGLSAETNSLLNSYVKNPAFLAMASANGFIPNFAYKQAVMGLEESMSGNKAIFDTKPFPHIRNKSQPTFSSAIADHGGLGNALSDSMRGQKAAGLMNKGFVPNFAKGDRGISGRNIDFATATGGLMPGMGSQLSNQAKKELIAAINDEIKSFKAGKISRDQLRNNTDQLMKAQNLGVKAQEDLNKRINQNVKNVEKLNEQSKKSIASKIFGDKKGESFDKNIQSRLGGVTGILSGSLIGGQLENLIQGGRERYELSAGEKFGASASSGVLTAATTGAEIGAFIPVLGPAAGAAIGALIGLGKAAYDAQETLEDMQKASENYAAITSKTSEAAQNYIQQLSGMTKIENAADRNIAAFKLQETFDEINKVSPALGKKFLEAGGDITLMQKAIKDFVKTTQEISSAKKIKSNLAQFSQDLKDLSARDKREKLLKKQGYDVASTTDIRGNELFAIKETEASLETSFRQFSGFFEIIRNSGMDAEKATNFMSEFADELSSVYVSESKLKQIGIKFGLAEEIATELASIGDDVIEEMGPVGKFFIKNSTTLIKKMFDGVLQTVGQQSEKAEFNARPILKKIDDSISAFVLNTASKIQSLEFEKSKLKILEDAASLYLDSIVSPIEKAARESALKSKDFESKITIDRKKLTSDITEGLRGAPKILGSSDVGVINKVEDIINTVRSSAPTEQFSIIDRLISQTESIATAQAAGFKVEDDKALKSLNESLSNFRKNIILLNQSERENSQLLNLEIDVNKRRAETSQRLLQIQNQLVKTESERAIVAARQLAATDIREARFKVKTETPGYGFGASNKQIATEKIDAERQFMQERNFTAIQNRLAAVKSAITTPNEKAITNLRNAILPEQIIDLKSFNKDIENTLLARSFDEFSKKLSDTKSLRESIDILIEFRNTLEKSVDINTDAYSDLFTTISKQIEQSTTEFIKLNSEVEKFEINAQADIKIANVNDKINNQYISRLNTLLQIEKTQRGILNTIEIEEQRLDVAKSRPANFFGLGVTGKAEKQIGFDEQSLALRQRRQTAQAVQNVQAQFNQFETFRSKIQAQGLGGENFGYPASSQTVDEARKAIMNLDTKKITNVNEAKNFADQLSNIRTEYGLQGEAATTLADTEKEITSILNSNVDELDKMRKIQDILNGKVRQEAKDRQSIRIGFKEGFDQIQEDADTGLNRLAKDTPILFRDGMVDAIKATIRESDNLGNALMGIASKFLDTFSTQLMTTGISKIISGSGLGSIFGAQTGGLIRAQSGMYISGTGSGDKYPAMLENGEYVLNRRAVMAMGGPAALDTLNFSAAPRFASGGSFKQSFDTIPSMESNMTQMGLENSPLYNELTDAAKQKAEEDRRKKLAAKQQRAAMIGSLVAAAATVAIGAGISNVAQNAQATKAKAFSNQMAETRGSNPLMMSGKEFSQLQKFQSSNLISPSGFSYIGGTPQTGFRSLLSSPVRGQAWYEKAGSAISKPFRRQTGGLIGSRLSDTIPGYMEGGLYDSSIVKRYGTGMQGGGSSIMAAGNNSSTVNNNTSANNSFNFNTSVQRDGSLKMGSNTTSYEQQDVELSKNLNNKIYAAVGEVIRKEKQFGGSLAGVRT